MKVIFCFSILDVNILSLINMSGNFCHKAATYHKFLKKYPASVKLQHQISTQGKLQKLNKHLLLLRAFIQYTPLARGGGGEGGGGLIQKN